MRFVATLGLFLACLVVCASPAAADQITVTDAVSIMGTGGAQFGNFTVSAFDSSLGTLNSVDVTFIATLNGHSEFQNTTPYAGTFTRSLSSINQLRFPAASMFVTASPDAGEFSVPVAAHETVLITFPETVVSNNWSTSNPAWLASFLGTGNLSLIHVSALQSGGTVSSDEGAITGTITSRSGVTDLQVTLTYDFTRSAGSDPVPEPSTVALFAAGAVGILLARRRRKSRV